MNDYSLEKVESENRVFKVVQSNLDLDEEWDSYLANTPGAQFEQTSLWAKVKALDGWSVNRMIFYLNGQIAGGYQILFKEKKMLGKIGYIIKGPTYTKDSADIGHRIGYHIVNFCKAKNINILIIQLPLNAAELGQLFSANGFIVEEIVNISAASVVVDLSNKSIDELYKEVKRQKKQNIKHAIDHGIGLIEGAYHDLDLFFALMLDTCKRQKVNPNPKSIETLKTMWNLFEPKNLIRLFFTEMNREKISGVIAIIMHTTIFLWKFGWSGKYAHYRPNDFLFWKLIEWSKEHGYESIDFVGVGALSLPDTARESSTITAQEINARGSFKFGFGGDIIVFPKARTFIGNKIHKALYICSALLMKIMPNLMQPIKAKVLRKYLQ